MNWTDGYVADAEYTSHYFAELAPPHIDLAALSAGIQPPDREGGKFRYCELGCGNGMSTNLLAACHPQAEFVGIDFMPVHIANSRKLAKKAALKNVQFLELSFADACTKSFEPFDYIVAHGVYSWITAENRAEMVEFYRRFLAPGGLVYVSYNALPGWHSVAPLQKIVNEHARTLRGPSTQRARAGFDFAKKLADLKSLVFTVQPGALQQVTKAASQPANYLAQEYLNDAWHPMYITDVMREMADAKLEYVASATLAENDMRFIVTDEQAAVIREQPTAELRELVKDMCMNARFRRDLYTRGGRRLSPLDHRLQILRQHFALTKSPTEILYTVDYLGRKLGFDSPLAHQVTEVLGKGPQSLGALMKLLGPETADPARTMLELCLVLCVSGQAIPADPPAKLPAEMNRLLSASALEDSACNALATPFGAGILVSQIEMALLGDPARLANVPTGVQFLEDLAKAKGRVYNHAGKPLRTPEEVKIFLTEQVETVHRLRVPVFRQLGMLPQVKTK